MGNLFNQVRDVPYGRQLDKGKTDLGIYLLP